MKEYLSFIFSVKIIWLIRGLIYKFLFGNIGSFSIIGKPLYIKNYRKIFIGNKVRIFPNLRAEVHGNGKIIISDNVSIGHNLHITAHSELKIGSGTTIAGNVLIMSLIHDVIKKDIPYMDQPIKGEKTIIGSNCLIGSNSAIMAGCKIGNQCIIASNSVVIESFGPYSLIAGNPAKLIKKINF